MQISKFKYYLQTKHHANTNHHGQNNTAVQY